MRDEWAEDDELGGVAGSPSEVRRVLIRDAVLEPSARTVPGERESLELLAVASRGGSAEAMKQLSAYLPERCDPTTAPAPSQTTGRGRCRCTAASIHAPTGA